MEYLPRSRSAVSVQAQGPQASPGMRMSAGPLPDICSTCNAPASNFAGAENAGASRESASARPAKSFFVMLFLRGKDLFDRFAEQLRDGERERQAGVVSSGFDCVHGLARYLELVGEIALAPAAFGPQFAHQVFHRVNTRRRQACSPHTRPITGQTQNMLKRGNPADSRKPYVRVRAAVTAAPIAMLSRLRRRRYSSMRRKWRA